MANRRFIDFPVATTVGANDIILIWQDGLNKQTTKATILSGLPEDLEDLSDVNISGLTNGQILRYDSTTGNWVNSDQGDLNLNDLNDVSIVSPANGQVLVYNSSTSKWENSSAGLVPYVGAVTTVDLGAQGLRAGYVRFNTSVVSVPDEQGLMYWDASRSTAALIMNGTIQHIGQDSFFYVKNSSGSTISKGTCVRFAGTDGASGHLLVVPFLANGSVPSTYFMGVTAEEITNGAFGQVMHFGELTGIDTSGFSAGALLYASSTVAGAFQTTAPTAPNNIVLVAAAVNSKNNGAIVVRPTYGSNINDDEGVKITSPTTGDLLQLQAGGLWENKTKAQILGGTSSQFVKGDGSLDSTTYQPLLTNPVTGTGTTNYLPKFTGSTTIGNSLFTDNGTNAGYNNAGVAARTFIIQATSGRPLALEVIENSNVHAVYIYPNNSGFNRISSDYMSGGTFLPLSLTGRENNADLVCQTSGNITIGTTSDNGARLQVSGGDLTVRKNSSLTNPEADLGFYNSFINTNSTNGTGSAISLGSNSSFGVVIYGQLVNNSTNEHLLGFQTRNSSGSGGTRMVITGSGNVLIGTTTDSGSKLQVSGSLTVTSGDLFFTSGSRAIVFNSSANFNTQIYEISGAIVIRTGGNDRITTNSAGNVNFSSLGTGTVYSTGGTLTNVNPSDFNLKENIAPINYGLCEILQLNPVTFSWKNDTINQGKQYGFIAQEVQKIMPDLVKKGEYLGLDKEAIFTTLVKAIQEQQEIINDLKQRIK